MSTQTIRKIAFDPSVYCLPSMRSFGGDEHCNHDFDPHPQAESRYGATWICTKCGRQFDCEAWH